MTDNINIFNRRKILKETFWIRQWQLGEHILTKMVALELAFNNHIITLCFYSPSLLLPFFFSLYNFSIYLYTYLSLSLDNYSLYSTMYYLDAKNSIECLTSIIRWRHYSPILPLISREPNAFKRYLSGLVIYVQPYYIEGFYKRPWD